MGGGCRECKRYFQVRGPCGVDRDERCAHLMGCWNEKPVDMGNERSVFAQLAFSQVEGVWKSSESERSWEAF
jgi:hypothetical protein